MIDEDIQRTDTEIEKEYKEKHKNWRRHWEFPGDFPSTEVIQAYLRPNVDENKEPFTWTEPAFRQLTDFAVRNLNWHNRDIDQYLIQVGKRLKELEGKKKGTLEQYFKKEERFVHI